MTIVFLNTAVAGTLTAPLYRNGGESYSVFIYRKNPKGKSELLDSYTGTRSECNKFRNAALTTG